MARALQRRAIVRIDAVLIIAVAAVLAGYAVVAPALVCGAAVVGVALLAGRVPARVIAAAVCAGVVSGARACAAVPAFEARWAEAIAALGGPRRCAGTGTVVTSPALRDGALSYVAHFDALDCEGRPVKAVLVRLREGPASLARGDSIDVTSQLAPVELFRNAELPDPTPSATRAGVLLSGAALSVGIERPAISPAAWIDRARAHVRARIEATFAPAAAPLARALVLGENDLSEEDGAAFRSSGLAHLLAVSGTHLVFAVLGIVNALSFVLVRVERVAARLEVARVSSLIGAVLALFYADFAGGSGSAWRAAWMLSAGLGARALGRHPSAIRSFALSLAVGACLDPLVGFDVSFLLSCAATAGLLGLGPVLTALIAPPAIDPSAPVSIARRVWRAALGSTAVTVAAMIPCTPLLSTLGPRLTLSGIAANVAAVPFGEIVSLPLCLVHAVLPGGALQLGVARVASGALLVVRWLAHLSAAATFLSFPVPPPGRFHFVVLGVAGAGAALARGRALERRAWLVGGAVGLVVVEMCAVRAGHPLGVLRVTVLDVGQGDSELVDLPGGALMLVDGGGFVGSPVDPGASVVLPLLRVRRRERIDVAVLTHPHPDHFLGLSTVLRSVEVGELWDTGQGRAQGAGPEYAAMIADLTRRKIPIRGPDSLCGARVLSGAIVRVLSPCPAFDPARGANDNSFVIRLGLGDRHALLTGDAEHDAEADLLQMSPGELEADLLKVGHHGSRTSTTPELVRRVAPRFATVSCGVRNRFGHPHPATLQTLAGASVRAIRMDVSGSAEWWTDGDGQSLRVFGGAFAERTRAPFW